MFWTDNSIQTSFTTEEVLIAVGIFLAATIIFLIRLRISKNTSTKGAFLKNFIKLLIIPLLLAIAMIFLDAEKIADFFN